MADKLSSKYLFGWKAVASYIGVHIRTVMRWHLEVKRLPYLRVFQAARKSLIYVEPTVVDLWLFELSKNKKPRNPNA